MIENKLYFGTTYSTNCVCGVVKNDVNPIRKTFYNLFSHFSAVAENKFYRREKLLALPDCETIQIRAYIIDAVVDWLAAVAATKTFSFIHYRAAPLHKPRVECPKKAKNFNLLLSAAISKLKKVIRNSLETPHRDRSEPFMRALSVCRHESRDKE